MRNIDDAFANLSVTFYGTCTVCREIFLLTNPHESMCPNQWSSEGRVHPANKGKSSDPVRLVISTECPPEYVEMDGRRFKAK